MHDHAHHEPAAQRRWEWWTAITLGITAFGFGAYGLRLYKVTNHEPVDPFSVGYHTLQLFILDGPHLEHSVPWQLNLGRWLAAAVILGAVALSLYNVFWSEYRLFRARFSLRGGHVVICGLGRLGIQLAREFRMKKEKVIMIDEGAGADEIAEAYRLQIALIRRESDIDKALRAAVVRRASRIIAATDDDQKNVAIAVRAGNLRKKCRNEAECWLFVGDPRLQQMLRKDGLFPHTSNLYKVKVRGLDFFELTARRVLGKVPLDFEPIRRDDTTAVHLIIFGFGRMGQNLALQAARIGHFANFRKIRITVLEQEGSKRTEKFRKEYPNFDRVCEVDYKSVAADGQVDPAAAIRALGAARGDKELVTAAACWESPGERTSAENAFFVGLHHDDGTNLSLALALARDRTRFPQILVFQTLQAGFCSLFPVDGRDPEIGPRCFPFGMLEETWTVGTLVHEEDDKIAQALHENYYDKQLAKKRVRGETKALYPWAELSEFFRESNRRAADHIPVKLRAINHVSRKHRDDVSSVEVFDREQIELLAEMEHESWCAEKLLQNYSYGPDRDEEAKIHPSLVPWKKLDDSVKQYDRDQVIAIPEALLRVKCGIYPQGI